MHKIPFSNPGKQVFKITTKQWHILDNHLIHRCLSIKSKNDLALYVVRLIKLLPIVSKAAKVNT